MKLSIITPTHDITFLKELEASILVQTYQDWEWVILLNHGAEYSATDERIKIEDCPFESDSVGLLKRIACMQTTGDIIIEVDHDDMLTPDCLEKVANAFEDPLVGFVYSINAKLSKDFRPYGAEYGWSYGFYKWKGQKLYAMDNQPLYPGRLGYIWFAPDHIRAWRKSVYDEIGGHNDSLSVCDDLDLMHRLYLKTKFKEIPEVLYIYRITKNNTFLCKNELIQQTTQKLYNKNILALAERYADLNSLKCVKQEEIQPGFLTKYSDNSIGLIVATDQLNMIEDQRALMTEIHRVLAPGGMLISSTPSTDGPGAFADPRVKSYWNEHSFKYWTQEKYARQINNKRLFRVCRLCTKPIDEIPHVIAHLEKI
jgi:glycosyltransferase involved in cell wall biosynthesis